MPAEIEHRLLKRFQYPEIYAVCSCGERIDAGSDDQLEVLHRRHAEHERAATVYRPAARRGLAAARDRLRATADQKAGA